MKKRTNKKNKSAVHVNHTHKDSIFSLLFGTPDNLRRLYNAVTNAHYDKNTPITINTLTDALYMNRLNDISFTIGEEMVIIFEHQSTINENMPLRILLYIARIYEKITEEDTLYRKALIKLPRPRFIVLYNGIESFDDHKILKLSDAFLEAECFSEIRIELEVEVYNINYGRNAEMLAKDENLKGYAAFIEKIRINRETVALKEAVDKAVKDCMSENILKDFLKSISSEVYNMLFTEWNQEKALEVRYREGMEAERKASMEKIEKIEKERKVSMEKIEEEREKERKELIALLRSGTSPEEIIKLYDKDGRGV
ncbi:hypothetical protein FACS1894172_10710 [Spirochaetia bacterium]|nr:hypothetical protein FACS1894164_20860 [Spirochaetia bacterium]GHU33007.1 hypothetical protein FACS1894172_10710 [Spirochaetia bacterium]